MYIYYCTGSGRDGTRVGLFIGYLTVRTIATRLHAQPLLIYIVEDDEEDQYLLRTALESYKLTSRLRFFANGSELLVWLTHQLDGMLPDLILLDLHTPILNGFETLQLLKQAAEYKSIPVLIRSGCEDIDVINRCYELGCQGYLMKTTNQRQLANAIGTLKLGRSLGLPVASRTYAPQ